MSRNPKGKGGVEACNCECIALLNRTSRRPELQKGRATGALRHNTNPWSEEPSSTTSCKQSSSQVKETISRVCLGFYRWLLKRDFWEVGEQQRQSILKRGCINIPADSSVFNFPLPENQNASTLCFTFWIQSNNDYPNIIKNHPFQ